MTLRHWNVRRIDEALVWTDAFNPFASGSDRGAWAAIRDRAGQAAAALLKQARADLATPVPALPASLYLDFQRTGQRVPYEDAQRRRRNMLYRLVLAECLSWEGTFLDAISDVLWARLEETNWAWPAHAGAFDAPGRPTLDLAAAMTALDLAEIDYLLGDRLAPNLRAHIVSEVDRRAIAPFLERHDHGWLHPSEDWQAINWTAVCVAGVAGAACYLEVDRARLAEVLARGLATLEDYLGAFDSHGGTSEGPDYWNYGFGNFVVLAQIVEARTAGAVRLLDDPHIHEIALFPARTLLAPGLWASFSDSDPDAKLDVGLLNHLAERLQRPELSQLGGPGERPVEHFIQFAWALRQFIGSSEMPTQRTSPNAHDWFPEMAWMISRCTPEDPRSLRVAVKGGHNGEMHNHNDVGALIVVVNCEGVITDPGRGRYSKSYFGPQRYENLMASSLGHSVPVVNGHLQAAGRAHAAKVLEHRHDAAGDALHLDMTAAYPDEARLERLHRMVEVDRRPPGGTVRLTDTFAFRGDAGVFESVLVTAGEADVQDGTVVMRRGEGALEVAFDPASLSVRLERHPGVEKQYAPSVDLTRVIFTAPPTTEGRVSLTIRPHGQTLGSA